MAKGSNTFGGTVKLEGESEYRKALTQITQNLKEVSSEMKVVSSAYDKNDTSTSALSDKSRALGNILSQQSDKVKVLKDRYNEMEKQYGSTSENQQKLTQKLNEEKQKLSEIGSTLGTTSKEYLNQQKVVSGLESTQESYNKAVSEAKIQMNKAQVEANKTSSQLKNLEQAENSAGQGAIKMGDFIKANIISEYIIRGIDALVGKIKSVGSAVGNVVIHGGIDRALNLENARAKMSTFTKSTKQLDEIMNNVSDSVDGTAFSMDSAATVAAGLFAAGIKEGPEMTNSLKLVGDAAQVSGRSMEEVGAIFNKVAANGKLSGQELNQLSDSGIPILQMLSKTTGKSAEEVRKMVSDGKIGFAEFSKAMEEGLGGAAQKSGETFTSSLANLKSACSRLGATLMTPILEGVTPVMNTFKDMLKLLSKGTTDGLDELANKLEEQIMSMVDGIITNIGPFLDKLLPVLNNILEKILQILPQALPQLINMITTTITQLIGILLNNLPQIVNTLTQAVLQIVKAIAGQLPTLIPQIIDAVLGIVDALISNIDLFISAGMSLLGGLMGGLIEGIPKLIEKIPEIVQSLVDALIKNLPMLIDGAIELVMQLVYALPTIITALVQALPTVITAVVDGLLNALPILIEGAITLVIELVKALPVIIVELIKAIPSIVKSIAKAFVSHAGTMIKVGGDLIKALWRGFKSWMSTLYGKLLSFAKAIPSKIKSGIGNVLSIGKNLVQGIWNGISNAKQWVLDKIKGFGKSILNGLKSFFGIHSPSKVMKDQIGKNIALGVIEGINSKKKNVKKSAEELSKLYVKAANIKKLEKSNKLNEMQEITYWQTIVKHVKKGTSAYKTALSNFNKAKDKFSKDISKITSTFASNVEKLNQDISKRQQDILNSLNLFDKVKFNTGISKEALTENLQSQVSALKEWDKTLNSLNKKVKNKDLYNYLQSQGVDSLKTLQQFDSMSSKELKEYERLYAEKQKVAQKRAENEYAGQLSALKNSYLKDLKSLGVDGSKTSKTVGKQIASGINTGFKDGMKGVSKTTKTQLNSLIKSIKKQLKIKSPSKVFRDEIGKNLALGIGVGFEGEMKNVSRAMNDAIPTDFNITPDVSTGFNGKTMNSLNQESKGDIIFNSTINNNSKYTSPAENVRLLRKEYQLQKLKYGRV